MAASYDANRPLGFLINQQVNGDYCDKKEKNRRQDRI